jgi:hypothetical protein
MAALLCGEGRREAGASGTGFPSWNLETSKHRAFVFSVILLFILKSELIVCRVRGRPCRAVLDLANGEDFQAVGQLAMMFSWH